MAFNAFASENAASTSSTYSAATTTTVSTVAGTAPPVYKIFVAGIPDDVRPREIHNLFRPYKDYIAATQLDITGTGSVCIFPNMLRVTWDLSFHLNG